MKTEIIARRETTKQSSDCPTMRYPAKTGLPRSPAVARNDAPAILPIYSITPFTMLDFPDLVACIIWFSGCNMRCTYCHNPCIVKDVGNYPVEKILDFLERRRGLLDGVVLSGGEATVYRDLPGFARTIKNMGFAIKLDTNGTRSDIVKQLLDNNLLDYIALDYKAPPEKFKKVTGIRKFEAFSKTLDLLCSQKKIPFEIRTTIHTALMDEHDIATIIKDLEQHGYDGTYYVQNFRFDNDRPTLGSLPPQIYELDTDSISIPEGFDLKFRNF